MLIETIRGILTATPIMSNISLFEVIAKKERWHHSIVVYIGKLRKDTRKILNTL